MPHTWGPKAGHQFQKAAPSTAAPAIRTVAAPRTPAVRRRVLFVCIGNSCRSQMAEGFARTYGADVIEPCSAGLAPATLIAPLTRQVMFQGKHIDLTPQFPKSIFEVPGPFDIIVNLSGERLPPQVAARDVRTWPVADPVAGPESAHLSAANAIEGFVQQLILELRGPK